MKKLIFIICLSLFGLYANAQENDHYATPVEGRWSTEKINEWYAELPWLVGANYVPATAINQIEMWQASTWDPQTIDKELSWAAGLGMNTMRVYLHDLVWADDEAGLYERMDEFMDICGKYNIRPFFVFFDDCHYPNPQLGAQPLPVIALHNSGWVNCPARAVALRYADGTATKEEVAQLEGYVKNTIAHFKDDSRVLMWELYNEPGRGNGEDGDMSNTTGSSSSIREKSNKLVYESWVWAREINPSQPIMSCTAGSIGKTNILINRVNSDLHSIHSYMKPEKMRRLITDYQQDGRPLIMTEWLARERGSTVEDILPILKELNVAAVNWGFVSGKSGTVWPWTSRKEDGKVISLNAKREAGEVLHPGDAYPEPELWFHDLYRVDGSAYDDKEVELFRELTGVTGAWKPVETPITTRWGKNIAPNNVWQQYPRPQMVRADWINLNGLWDYTVKPNTEQAQPSEWTGQILVPFSIEAPLSGVGRDMATDEAIWYKRELQIPAEWKNDKVLIHFEASDFETTAWINGEQIGTHKGAYQPFFFEVDAATITDKSELLVKVTDPKTEVFRSMAKQGSKKAAYETCTGLWQTVWMEPVSKSASIDYLKIQANLEEVTLALDVNGDASGLKAKYEIYDNGKLVKTLSADANATTKVTIENPKLWSPDSPFLYDIKVSLLVGTEVYDAVDSYFGMRTIEFSESSEGSRMLLNGQPIFQYGPLDQNFWPGGGFTPPSDAAMEWEAQYLKRIGCNMVRMHIKQNPRRFYHHCDKLGLLVWQDYVCGRGNKYKHREQSDFWFGEQKEMVKSLYNHPSIVMWIVFNEAWGQHDTERIYKQSLPLDDTRIWSVASGWDDSPLGHIRDIHDYTFRPSITAPGEDNRVIVLGECGGFGSAVSAHNWLGRSNQTGEITNPLHCGFNPEIARDTNEIHDLFRPTYTAGVPFQKQYQLFIDHLRLLQNSGLDAAIYTEMTDMKMEENGWLTFDREVSKIHPDSLGLMHNMLYEKAPVQTTILPTSMHKVQDWAFANVSIDEITNKAKAQNELDAMVLQEMPDFSAMDWTKGNGPFGNYPDLTIGSLWDGKSQLFIQKEIKVKDVDKDFSVRVYTKMEGEGKPWMHTRVYVNGVFVGDETARQIKPELRLADIILPSSLMHDALKKGKNTITVQFVPGLLAVKGVIDQGAEHVLVDVELMEIQK